jgi:DNA (cytosine-5)-methyltransferase 1
VIVDLFAGGPSGWTVAAHQLGHQTVGVELDRHACATRALLGYPTLRADVAEYPRDVFTEVDGICASPPCPAFSMAGNGAGRDAIPMIVGAALAEDRETLRAATDPGVWLVLEPLWWTLDVQPTWVAWEQVPPVLPVWQACANVLRRHGWQTWTGVLCAADYGTPQTRRRAILMASRVRQPMPPQPSHAQHPGMLGELPWVSMADALGWNEHEGVAEWRGAGMIARHHDRRVHPATEPSPTVLGKGRNMRRLDRRTNSRGAGGIAAPTAVVDGDRPAPTVTGGRGRWVWRRPATTVQGDPRIAPPGHHDRQMRDSIPVTASERLILQGFPGDLPIAGTREAIDRQIGNAIPPQLALAAIKGAS